jgi:hypothetical protein
VGGGRESCCFWPKIPWWKREYEMVSCRDATARSFVTKVWGKAFKHFHAVAVKRHSSKRNWLFGLPEQIICKQSSYCQRKLWACSWVCSSPVSPSSVSEFGFSMYGSYFLPWTLV